MAGRIDLNLPPRLIESARAAQYTNREVLGARALEQRIKAKARRRQEAAIRANPRLITPQQREGGQLEFQQAPLQRIWRRPRRREGEIDMGIGWFKGVVNKTVISENYPIGLLLKYEAELMYHINIYLGSSDASHWQTVSFNITQRIAVFDNYPISLNRVESNCAWIDLLFLPAGGKSLVALIGVHEAYFDDFAGIKTTTNLSCRAFLITNNQVEMLSASTLPFFERLAASNSLQTAPWAVGGLYFWAAPDPTMYRGTNFVSSSAAQPIEQLPPTHSSSMYEYIRRIDLASTTPSEGGSLLSNVEARQLYKQFSGSDQIPVALYKRSANAPSFWPNPLSEAGELGFVNGAQITDSPTPSPFQSYVPHDITKFDFQEDYQVSPNAIDPTGTIYTGAQLYGSFTTSALVYGENRLPALILAHDYHGGTYCRDQLAALGVTLP